MFGSAKSLHLPLLYDEDVLSVTVYQVHVLHVVLIFPHCLSTVFKPLKLRLLGDQLGEDEGDGEDHEEHSQSAQGEGDEQTNRLEGAHAGLFKLVSVNY